MYVHVYAFLSVSLIDTVLTYSLLCMCIGCSLQVYMHCALRIKNCITVHLTSLMHYCIKIVYCFFSTVRRTEIVSSTSSPTLGRGVGYYFLTAPHLSLIPLSLSLSIPSSPSSPHTLSLPLSLPPSLHYMHMYEHTYRTYHQTHFPERLGNDLSSHFPIPYKVSCLHWDTFTDIRYVNTRSVCLFWVKGQSKYAHKEI